MLAVAVAHCSATRGRQLQLQAVLAPACCGGELREAAAAWRCWYDPHHLHLRLAAPLLLQHLLFVCQRRLPPCVLVRPAAAAALPASAAYVSLLVGGALVAVAPTAAAAGVAVAR